METCTWFQSQNAAAPLTPTPTPSHLWQMCATDIFMLEGIDHLVVGDFYSKMIFVQCLPPGQSNANKVVLTAEGDVLRAWHLWSPSLWQWPAICKCSVCQLLYNWGISHETWSPHYLQSNGFAKACVKVLPNMHSIKPSIVVLIHTLLC